MERTLVKFKDDELVTFKYNVRLNFFWDDGDDMKEFVLIVPMNVTIDDINEELTKAHHFLCCDDEEDTYGTLGRTPETLLEYVCQKNRWVWTEMAFDIDLNFN